MKKYESPILEIETLETTDIMASSVGGGVSVEHDGDSTYAGTNLGNLMNKANETLNNLFD